MTFKTRLIIVFSALTISMILFGFYARNTIQYINNMYNVESHIANMNESILEIALIQQYYYFSGDRSSVHTVYEKLNAIRDQLQGQSALAYTESQVKEFNQIIDYLDNYDDAFATFTTYNDQLKALQHELFDLRLELNLLVTNMTLEIAAADESYDMKQILTSLNNNYQTVDELSTHHSEVKELLSDVSVIAKSIKDNDTLSLPQQLTGHRIEIAANDFYESLSKYNEKQQEYSTSSYQLFERTSAIRDSLDRIHLLQDSAIDEVQTQIYYVINIALLLVVTIFLGVIYYTIRFITINLDTLLNATRKITTGDYSTRIEKVRDDEFGQLSTSINTLVTSLETSTSRQEEIMDNLEKMVDSRTAELREAKQTLELVNHNLEKEKNRLAQVAVTDELTGLHNRRATLKFLQEQMNISLRYNKPLTIMEVDIDHFKSINDKHGHLAGDEVLIKLGNIFATTIREIDFVGRFGGEEFLFIFPETSIENAKHIINRIHQKVQHSSFTFSNIKMTFSGGVVEFTDETSIELIYKADRRLYKAKESGRNCIIYVDEKPEVD